MAHSRRADAPSERADGARFLIVEARYYETIGAMMLAGARAAFERAGASVEIVGVPGALEIAPAMKIALDAAQEACSPYAGAVALGCVIRGETYHFEIVSNESARALTLLGLERGAALGNGVLTVENEDQALERADPARGDKGGDAARAALALHALKRRLETAR
ncbi:6,7-dimethyl-8-ribityllumazine synthase [Methylocella sp.]|uniref:6,7-dimethyl-8-ribityllumazine synthase n=1 Tax=Methylocella sp. TaxID=1978226 RepID=UPI0035B21740